MIDARGLTEAAAAALLGVSQPRISDLVRGKIDPFSTDTLIDMLAHAGVRVSLVVRGRAGAALHRLVGEVAGGKLRGRNLTQRRQLGAAPRVLPRVGAARMERTS